MAGFFYQLGRKVGPKVRRGKWVWQSLFGSEQEMRAAERSVGEDLVQEVFAQLPHAEAEAKAQVRVARIGVRLSDCLRKKTHAFAFCVVEDVEPNAFALPGGFVFVTHSILKLCAGDDAQVAFILGHEMAHVLKGHSMERIVVDSAVSVASNLTVVRGAVAAWARKAGIAVLQNAHSQDRELQADAFATRLVRAAGYDPLGGERLLRACGQASGEGQGRPMMRYFHSHPPTTERIGAIRAVLGRSGGTPSGKGVSAGT